MDCLYIFNFQNKTEHMNIIFGHNIHIDIIKSGSLPIFYDNNNVLTNALLSHYPFS